MFAAMFTDTHRQYFDKMRISNFQKSNIILFTALIVIVIAAFSVGIYLFLQNSDDIPVTADTESETFYETKEETSSDTETEPPIIETTSPPESETAELSYDEKRSELLVEYASELGAWIKESTPIYKTEAETDESGNTLSSPESYKPPVAFYYMDIASGNIMEYNSEYVFYTASVIKAPYVLWALKEIERAESEGDVKGTKFDIDRVFIYTEDKFKSGSGIIQNSDFGSSYTSFDLLKLTITHSDNVAFSEIRNIWGRKGFNEFSESIGVINPQKKLFSANAREMGAYMLEIYKYFESGGKYSEAFKNWMLGTNHRIMIPSAVNPSVAANKYGWDLDAYHDMAIVFDEHPYLLVIMTELENGSREDNVFIRELASRINEIHISLYETEPMK